LSISAIGFSTKALILLGLERYLAVVDLSHLRALSHIKQGFQKKADKKVR
jgi:hypothetical protein